MDRSLWLTTTKEPSHRYSLLFAQAYGPVRWALEFGAGRWLSQACNCDGDGSGRKLLEDDGEGEETNSVNKSKRWIAMTAR